MWKYHDILNLESNKFKDVGIIKLCYTITKCKDHVW